MEKLIELLNEYNGQDSYWLDEDSISKEKYINRGDGYQCFINEHIISKRFGFIKWLVDNDKIDTSKANDKNLNVYEIELRIRAVKELVADSEEKTVLYLNLLMLLAIQDSPIEYLISILR